MSKMNLRVEGDTHVVVTRHFAASPEALYRAHTEPEIIRQWLTGPDGWSMPHCVCEAKPGGNIRYDWADSNGNGFYLTGEFVALEPFSRIEHIERMHLPDPTPDNHVVTTFEPKDGGTQMTMRMSLPDKQTRDAMLATGMEHGMEASYQRFEQLQEAKPV